MAKNICVIGIGELMTDEIYKKTGDELKLIKKDGGGTLGNALCNLSHKGIETIALGVCGDDIEGTIAVESLKSHGINADNCLKLFDRTKKIYITIPDGSLEDDSITMKIRNPFTGIKPTSHYYDGWEDKIEIPQDRNCIIVADNPRAANNKLINKLKEKNSCKAVMDIGHIEFLYGKGYYDILDLMQGVDILQINENVAEYLYKKYAPEKTIESLHRLFCLNDLEAIIITKGSKGVEFAWKEDSEVKSKQFNINSPSKIIDSCGAGDAFLANFIEEYIENEDRLNEEFFRKVFNSGIRLTSKVVSSIGARGHLDKSDIRKVMKGNFEKLQDRIIDASQSGAYEGIKELIEKNQGNTLTVGSGGSFVVADYISGCLKCFALKPREFLCHDLKGIDNVVFVTFSGTTPDIMQCIEHCKSASKLKNINVLTYDGSKLSDNDKLRVIEYKNESTKENSYISIAATLAPISLFTRYFAEQKGLDFKCYLNKIFENAENEINTLVKDIDWSSLWYNPNIEIICESEAKSAGTLLESNFSETGIAYTVIHEKKDYSHGRYALQYNKKTPFTIWLKNSREVPYDKKLLELIEEGRDKGRLIKLESCEHGRTGEFELLLKSMFLTKHIAKELGVDISKIRYPEKARGLYHYDRELI